MEQYIIVYSRYVIAVLMAVYTVSVSYTHLERAARILERRLEAAGSSEGDWEHRRVEELLAEVLTRLALCTASGQEKDAQGASRFRDSIYGQKSALFSRALLLFEKNEGNERSAQEQSQFELYLSLIHI